MKNKKSLLVSISLFVMAVCIPLIAGFYAGRFVERQDHLISELAEKNSVVSDVETQADPPNSSTQGNVIRPSDLAKAKNVPEKVAGADGEYTLVSVVEGVEANQQMTENIRIVTAKRQKFVELSQQFNKVAASSVHQRELLAGQINDLKLALKRDLRVLAQSYSYSIENTYLLVPHVVSLVSVSEVDGENKTKLVHKFTTSAAYLEFQEKNDVYQQIRLTVSKDSSTKPKAEGPDTAIATDKQISPPKPSPKSSQDAIKLKDMRAEMIRLYQYDPESRHLLHYEKTALYARPAKS